MHSNIKLAELLSEMIKKMGSVGRLAREIGVAEKTVRLWSKKTDEEMHHLQHDSIELLLKAAQKMDVEIETVMTSPSLWNMRAPYDENLRFDPGMPPRQPTPFRNHRVPFLGHLLNSPFGASASVITSTAARVRFLTASGVDVVTFKTVRSDRLDSHPPQNIFCCSKDVPILKPGSTLPHVVVGEETEEYSPKFGMMNRFGMPSKFPEIWQPEFQASKEIMKEGQLLILSVVPTAKPTDSESVLIDDAVRVVEYALQAGAEVIEINCSCPNCSGMEGELFRNLELVEKICRAVNRVAGSAKIILKIGYLPEKDLSEFVSRTSPFVQGYSAINTIPVEGLRQGQYGLEPAFGTPGLKAGLSGPPIFRFGLECVRNLVKIREVEKLDVGIIGIGGAMTPANVQSYLDCGADVVQCANAFFVDSLFGIAVRKFLDSQLLGKNISAEDEREIARANWSRAVSSLEPEYGGDEAVWAGLQQAALADFVEWERIQKTTVAIGPRRAVDVPSVEEFKTRIRNRLVKPQF